MPAKTAPSEGPKVVNPTTRITVAFPFSQITLPEAPGVVPELAKLVADLTTALAVERPELKELAERAEGIAAQAAP